MEPTAEFLTPHECAEVDKALLTSQDKFAARVAIYALRSLKQIAQETGVAIDQLKSYQIVEWINEDASLQQGNDQSFRRFFAQLVDSSRQPLKDAAAANGVSVENLTLPQVIAWFEQKAKARIQAAPPTS